MERVIMLKWFKKLTDRLFGDEIEEEIEVPETTDAQYKAENEIENKRPTFRFPIITDAEIYGWDDDYEHAEPKIKNAEVENVVDDFEPMPLYQNDRWPTQEEIIKHRARVALEHEQSSPVKQSEKSEALKVELRDIQKKRRTDRFTPSKVPSPVYGYKIPELKKVHVQEPALTTEHSLLEKDEALKTLTELEENHVVEEVIASSIANERVTEEGREIEEVQEAQEVREYQQVEEINDMQEENEEIQTIEPISPPNVVDEKINEEEYQADALENLMMNDFQEEIGEELQQVEEDLPIPEEMIVQAERGQSDRLEEVHDEQSETDDIASSEEPTIERVYEERIVPFNVLMLKSDKKKLKAIEIAKEMQAKVKSVGNEEPVQVIEESTTLIESANEQLQEEREEREEQAIVESAVTHEMPQSIVQEEIIEEPAFEHYVLPAIDYLIPPESQIEDTEWLASQSEKLEESLSHFGVQANVINAVQGPTVTRFELTVGQGTKVSRVRNLADDLKLTLAARDIRIQAPIPGESSIGIEIPNRKSRAVRISEVIETESFQNSKSPLEAVLGLGLTGEPVTLDLRKMPHGMIAGATGSGKSVCINSILVSLLYKATPADLKMMLIDPKMVELAPFNGIPHLISPVITDVKAATAALKWAVAEMERRYELLAHAGVRDIERYNEKVTANRQFSLKMPYLLIVIDELADLMMMAPADVEVSISRIAQKARACGIHLIIATQRPSVDVITGIIKANIPTRIAFSVSSQVDSRTMIDTNGAERLLGRGDMLYVGSGESTPVRLQGTFVTDDEIERIIEHVQHEASPTYLFGQDELLKSAVEDDEDPLFIDACQFIFDQDSASTSMLQRNFSIGYNRAAKLMDRFEKLKFISPQQGSRARDVYLTEEQLNELKETIL